MNKKYIDIAKDVFSIESKAILDLQNLLTEDFSKAIDLILTSKGRLVISGMGKSGHVGAKIAATLASTGTPSFFMHPAEAMHGDLGMLTKDDVVLAISNSGESEEIVRIISAVKRMGMPLIGMAGNAKSTLAKESDLFLDITVKKEACPLQLAPTSSTTATLAMGDAIAVALMKARKFKSEDFAMFHPGGSLGRKLLTRVKDIMTKNNLPVLSPLSSFKEVVATITKGRLGLCIIVEDQIVKGIITDGDLRRALGSENDKLCFDLLAQDMMTRNPKSIAPNKMALEAEEMMLALKVNNLLVLDDTKLVGVIQLLKTGKV